MDKHISFYYNNNADGEELPGDEDIKYRKLQHIEGIADTGLKPGAKITIVGRVLPSAVQIIFDLCEKTTGMNKILHINPRFGPPYDTNIVVRNTCTLRGWGNEERDHGIFPFNKGNVFKIEIRCEKVQFHISVDGNYLAEYKYRSPLQSGRYLRILGDLEVIHVDIQNKIYEI